MISINSVMMITDLSGFIFGSNSHHVFPEDLGILNMELLSMIEALGSVPIVLREVIIVVAVHTSGIDSSRGLRSLVRLLAGLMVHTSVHLQSEVASLFPP